jgi:hypothetical protein
LPPHRSYGKIETLLIASGFHSDIREIRKGLEGYEEGVADVEESRLRR